MAEEIAAAISHLLGTCFKMKDLAPSWILIKTPIFLIATGLAVFDTYTDWKVVVAFREHVIDNPLIVHNPNWLRSWYFFTVVGTILTVVTLLHDGINLVYSMFLCCSKSCCKTKKSQIVTKNVEESEISKGEGEGKTEVEKEGKTEVEKEKSKDETITDPCRCCYRWGFNVVTRIETLSYLQLWFQNIPLLVISILYAATKVTCETPVRIHEDELADILLHVGISAIAATLATTFRLIRSSYRMFQTIGVRVKGWYCCKRLLPKPMNAVYPPDTRCQVLIFPYYAGLLLQYVIIHLMAIGTLYIWFYFISHEVTPSNNSTLGIYIEVIPGKVFRMFNISDNIIPPPKKPFLHFASISRPGSFDNEPIYCLSEFQYSATDAQIYYNTAQIRPVLYDGSFCNASYQMDPKLGNYDYCHEYFTKSELNMYFASGDPGTSSFKRFDETCILFKDSLHKQVPMTNISIKPHEAIDTTGYPKHGEKLWVFSPPPVNKVFYLVQAVVFQPKVISYLSPTTGEVIDCFLYFKYNSNVGVVYYSYIEVKNTTECSCVSQNNTSSTCMNLRYTYIDSQTEQLMPLTYCHWIQVMPEYVPIDSEKLKFTPSCPC